MAGRPGSGETYSRRGAAAVDAQRQQLLAVVGELLCSHQAWPFATATAA